MSIPPLPRGLPDDLRHQVANRLHSVAIRLLRYARAVDAEVGLSPQRGSLLSVLVFVGPRTISELAAVEQVTPAAISRIADGLEASGLARRERDQEDRRVVRLAATPAGRRLLERGRRARVERLAGLLAPLAGDELAKLGQALTALTKAVGLERAAGREGAAGLAGARRRR